MMSKTGPEVVRVLLSVAQLTKREANSVKSNTRRTCFSMVGSIYIRRSIDRHASACFRGEIGRVNHIYAFHGEVDAGTRFAARVDRADEIGDLLGESTEPIFVATRAIPAGLGFELFREILVVKDRGVGCVGFDGIV